MTHPATLMAWLIVALSEYRQFIMDNYKDSPADLERHQTFFTMIQNEAPQFAYAVFSVETSAGMTRKTSGKPHP